MAEGINIKTLPAATTVADRDLILIDKNTIGTQVIPFSSVVVKENQVTFYTDFVGLSAYTYALSASTNDAFSQVRTNIDTVSTNSITNSTNIVQLRTDLNSVSSNVSLLSTNTLFLRTDVNLVSSNVINLSTNTTTFISGGISPSGSIVPTKVGILYFAADTRDYFLSVDTTNNKDWRRILTVNY